MSVAARRSAGAGYAGRGTSGSGLRGARASRFTRDARSSQASRGFDSVAPRVASVGRRAAAGWLQEIVRVTKRPVGVRTRSRHR